MSQEELLLLDVEPEAVTPPSVQAEPLTEAKEEHNSLYWRTRCLRAEGIGTLDNVNSLTHCLEAIAKIAGEEPDEDSLPRIRKWAKTGLAAVWGTKGVKGNGDKNKSE